MLEIVGLEVMAEGVRAGTRWDGLWRESHSVLGAATLKLREPVKDSVKIHANSISKIS